MALTKETVIDRMEVVNGTLQVRRATYVMEDGTMIAGPMYERVSYGTGDDLTEEDETVQAVADMVWYPEIRQALAAYRAATTEQKNTLRVALGLAPLP